MGHTELDRCAVPLPSSPFSLPSLGRLHASGIWRSASRAIGHGNAGCPFGPRRHVDHARGVVDAPAARRRRAIVKPHRIDHPRLHVSQDVDSSRPRTVDVHPHDARCDKAVRAARLQPERTKRCHGVVHRRVVRLQHLVARYHRSVETTSRRLTRAWRASRAQHGHGQGNLPAYSCSHETPRSLKRRDDDERQNIRMILSRLPYWDLLLRLSTYEPVSKLSVVPSEARNLGPA